MDFHEALQEYGAKSEDQLEGRNYAFLIGKITNVSDNLVRVKARIGGQDDSQESDWIACASIGGIEATPNVGDLILVGFVDGDTARPFYLTTITTNMKNRPSEHMVLGDSMAAMFNYFVTQFNQLKTDFNSHIHTAGTFATAAGGGAVTGSSGSPATPTTANNGNKMNGADGSTVSDGSSSVQVLSSKAKVRK